MLPQKKSTDRERKSPERSIQSPVFIPDYATSSGIAPQLPPGYPSNPPFLIATMPVKPQLPKSVSGPGLIPGAQIPGFPGVPQAPACQCMPLSGYAAARNGMRQMTIFSPIRFGKFGAYIPGANTSFPPLRSPHPFPSHNFIPPNLGFQHQQQLCQQQPLQHAGNWEWPSSQQGGEGCSAQEEQQPQGVIGGGMWPSCQLDQQPQPAQKGEEWSSCEQRCGWVEGGVLQQRSQSGLDQGVNKCYSGEREKHE